MTTNADEPIATTIEADPDAGTSDLLRHAADLAIDYRSSLPDRRVGVPPDLTADDLRRDSVARFRRGAPTPATSSTTWRRGSNLGSSR